MQFFYRIFYSRFINIIYRNLLYPLRSILPTNMKIPVTGVLNIKEPSSDLAISFYSNESCPMVRILYWEENGFSFEFSPIFKQLITQCDGFIDIGANVGYYSLLAAKLNPKVAITSFEPSKGPLYFLTKNVSLNELTSIKVVDYAIGSENGTISFYEEKNLKYPYLQHHASGIGNTINSWGIDNFAKYDVKLTTLDAFLENNPMAKVDLIKMDTEGTENKIIEGALSTIKTHQPIIICEVLFGKIEQQMDELLQTLTNYKIFQFMSSTKKLVEVASLSSSTTKADVDTNFFFVPEHKVAMIQPFVLEKS
jgi:FkbM family methyltransferase